jgi:hypothetical protein
LCLCLLSFGLRFRRKPEARVVSRKQGGAKQTTLDDGDLVDYRVGN